MDKVLEIPILSPGSAESSYMSCSNLGAVTVFFLAQLSCIMYVIMQTIMKNLLLTESISVCEISFVRTASTLIISVPFVWVFKASLKVEKDLMIPLLVRCLSGSLAFIAVTKTISMIPLTIF